MRSLSIQALSHSAYDDLTQFIYLPAGIRLLAVAVFGWIGILGIILGWVLCHFLADEKTLFECIYIGVISGFTAYFSLLLWQWCYNINNIFEGMNVRLAILLVMISSVISAWVRYLYLGGIDPTTPFITVFLTGLCGDILGTFIVLYFIKGGAYLFRQFSKA